MMKDTNVDRGISRLKVYKASAGSGKTFTLAKSFINLLIANPKDYEHILAVTFTNKATAEMKERIVFNLFLLSYEHQNEPFKSKRESLLNAHINDNRTLGNSDEEIKKHITKRCLKALQLLLNDYSQFSISTIDSFVQKIIRAFAFEAGLNASYKIELDKYLILQKAIDDMMLSLSSNVELQEWLVAYMEDSLIENNTWRIESSVLKLAKVFFDEVNNNGFKGLQRADILAYRNELDEIIVKSRERLKFQRIKEFFENNGLDKTFIKNGGSTTIIKYIKNGYTEDKWLKHYEKSVTDRYIPDENGDLPNLISEKASLEHTEGFVSIITDMYAAYKDYLTAVSIKDQLYVVGILNDIQGYITNIQQQDNVMPISDTTVLLNRLIDGSDVPFIYEKIGSRFNNIMIDEFQDTSQVQWDNFKPLLGESLSHENNECLVVGDIKQAIYRWRHSDWKLLAQKIGEDFKNYIEETTLNYNFRSCSNVVRFNNIVFSSEDNNRTLPIIMENTLLRELGIKDSEISNIYSTARQELPAGKSENVGYVKAYFREAKSKNENKSDEQQETKEKLNDGVDVELANQIKELHDERGYEYRDMCILIRKRTEIDKFINALLEYDIPFVSSDSLKLFNSLAIKVIVAHYKLIIDPYDEIAVAQIVNICDESCDMYAMDAKTWQDRCNSEVEEVLKLRGYDLILMTERILSRLPQSLKDDQMLYIESFLDFVRRYCENQHVSLSDFVAYIDDKKESAVISAPEDQDAVTIMTIHKSKGLEFKCVFMPDINFEINPIGYLESRIWVTLPAPFDKINPMPLKFNNKLLHTHASDRYKEEIYLNVIDSLNLLYVAFTRAVDVLVLWSKGKTESTSLKTIGENLYFTLSEKAKDTSSGIEVEELSDKGITTFTIGSLETLPKHQNAETISTMKLAATSYNWGSWLNRIKVNLASDKDRYKTRGGVVNYGNVMHSVMERIRRIEDVERSVNKAVFNGELKEIDKASIIDKIKSAIESDELTKSWFDGTMNRIFIEKTIIVEDHEYRPDRVMVNADKKAVVVDYKFGKRHSNKYVAQIRRYMQLLNDAGYDIECGYLWYFEENDIQKIEWNVE